jgi:hypothetical protein
LRLGAELRPRPSAAATLPICRAACGRRRSNSAERDPAFRDDLRWLEIYRSLTAALAR